MQAVLGFAPHSGWAAVVIVGGDDSAPQVLHRGRIEMADAVLAGSKQPYHWIESHPLPEAERELKRFQKMAGVMAHEGIRPLVEDFRRQGYRLETAGILESSGRKGGSLEAILKSHALIHTADGDHFRDALAEGCARSKISVVRVPLRQLSDRAANALRLPAAELDARVRELGRPLGPPWTQDEKSACLLGWLLLSGSARIRKAGRRRA